MSFREWTKKAIPLVVGLSLVLIAPTFGDVKVLDSGMKVVEASAIKDLYIKDESEELILFTNDDWLYGYLDREGNVAIPATFKYAGSFHSGMAEVKTEEGMGFIDKSGQVLFYKSSIEEQFEEYVEIYDFYDGRALVEVGYYDIGYIDKSGKFVIPVGTYESGRRFNDGVAYVKEKDGDNLAIDLSGKVLFKKNDNWTYRDFSSDRAVVYNYLNKQYGYIDKSGKLVISFGLDKANDFVGEYGSFKEADKYGIIDKAGKFVVKPLFDKMKIMDNGYVLGYDGVFTILLN